jgi:hypothetical protein
MDKKVKNRWLKINSKGMLFNLPENIKLERDMTYPIAINIDIVDIQSPSNHDGTIDVKYIGQGTGELVVNDKDKKETVMIKVDKRKQSYKLRGQIHNEGRDYDYDMEKIRHLYNPYIIDLIEKLRKGEIE